MKPATSSNPLRTLLLLAVSFLLARSLVILLPLVDLPLVLEVRYPASEFLRGLLETQVVALAHERDYITALAVATVAVKAAAAMNIEGCLGFARVEWAAGSYAGPSITVFAAQLAEFAFVEGSTWRE